MGGSADGIQWNPIAYEGQTISGNTVTGDPVSGNPISYFNGTRWAFSWAEGRNLVSASSGNTNITYAYDHNGVRTTKTVNGVVHTYYYASGKLLRETYGGNTLDFFYDASGIPYAVKYNGVTYYYITNLQGDVVQIIDANRNVVASYEYDPYGKIISAEGTLAEINPLRYRGYYYDTETGFYYLQSRYYDPQIGRFINADSYASTGQGILGYNMFAYCLNNPVNYFDNSGSIATSVIVEAVLSGLIPALSALATGGSADEIVTAFITGFVGFAISKLFTFGNVLNSVWSVINIIAECISDGVSPEGMFAMIVVDLVFGNIAEYLEPYLEFSDELTDFLVGTECDLVLELFNDGFQTGIHNNTEDTAHYDFSPKYKVFGGGSNPIHHIGMPGDVSKYHYLKC